MKKTNILLIDDNIELVKMIKEYFDEIKKYLKEATKWIVNMILKVQKVENMKNG